MKSKKLIGLLTTATIVGSFCIPGLSAFADSFNVMAIGANLNAQQKQEMIKYFNAKPGSYEEVTINNQEEQNELKGIIPESEIGTRTISCAYVQPTQSGGINVKTANLTYVTASMISNALTTAGIYNANVIAAAPFQVSGTGALTGIMTSFEKATGKTISPEKKELANKELATTTKIAADNNVGPTKAAAVVNDVKSQVIQNGNQNQSQVAGIINNAENKYNVKLTPEQSKELNTLMQKISEQNYNKDAIEKSLDNIQDQLNKVLNEQGQLSGTMSKLEVHWDSFINWVEGIFSNNSSKDNIVNTTNNNSNIGKTAEVTGNNDNIKNAKPVVQTPAQENATLKAPQANSTSKDDNTKVVENNKPSSTGITSSQLSSIKMETINDVDNILYSMNLGQNSNDVKSKINNWVTNFVNTNVTADLLNKTFPNGYPNDAKVTVGVGEEVPTVGLHFDISKLLPDRSGIVSINFVGNLVGGGHPKNKFTPIQ